MSTLRERLGDDRTLTQERAGIGAWDVADVTAVVVEWLRDQAEGLSAESSPSLDNDLRHDIHVAAGEITGLADRVERGEA